MIDQIEEKIKQLNLTGKRVSKALIESRIQEIEYQTVILCGIKMMFCGIKMDNGFVEVGDPSVCIDPANWNEQLGKSISYENTFTQLWKLEAYRMLSEQKIERRFE